MRITINTKRMERALRKLCEGFAMAAWQIRMFRKMVKPLARPSRGMRKHIRRQKAAARRGGEVWT